MWTLVSLLISIEKFHSLFSKESGYIPFLSDENSNRKYYDDTEIKTAVSFVLQQIINSNINSSIRELYVCTYNCVAVTEVKCADLFVKVLHEIKIIYEYNV